jgi:hypothetical protein
MSNILLEADALISGERREEYGPATASLNRVASFWSDYLQYRNLLPVDTYLSGRDVAVLMILFKVARESYRPKHDNLVDIAGYAALAGEFGE